MLVMYPDSSKSAMIFLILAGLNSSPEIFESEREPMGSASEIYFSTMAFKRILDLLSIMLKFYN
jgi:hypothetical protein